MEKKYILFSWIENSIDYLCAFDDEGEAYELVLSLAEDMAYECWLYDLQHYNLNDSPSRHRPERYLYYFYVVEAPYFPKKN